MLEGFFLQSLHLTNLFSNPRPPLFHFLCGIGTEGGGVPFIYDNPFGTEKPIPGGELEKISRVDFG